MSRGRRAVAGKAGSGATEPRLQPPVGGTLPWALLLAALAPLPFLPALAGDLVWDDRLHLLEGAVVVPAGPYHRPLVFASYEVETTLLGGSAFVRHLTNLVVHALNTALLFLAARRSGVPHAGAALGAALFAVHPVQVEAVAYVSGRTDLLCTTAGLAAVLLLLTRRQNGAGADVLRGLAAAAAIAAACLAKETGYAFGLLVPWVAWRRAGSASRGLALGGPALLAAVLLFALRPLALPSLHPPDPLTALAAAGRTLFEFAGLLVWPAVLYVDRLTPPATSPASATAWALLALLAAAAAALGLRRPGGVGVWSAWTVATLLPVSNLLPIYPEIAARALFTPEHNLYPPLAGIGVLIGWGLAALAGSATESQRRPMLAAAALVLVALAARSWVRSRDWADEFTLFGAAARAGAPSPRVWYNLGNSLMQVPDRPAAIAAYGRAAELAPADAEVQMNLGVALQLEGRFDEALAAYERSLAIEDSPLTRRNLASLRARLGASRSGGGARTGGR